MCSYQYIYVTHGLRTVDMVCMKDTWAMCQYPIRHLTSRKVSKPCVLYLELCDRSEIWQAPRQQCFRVACQISERCDTLKYQSRSFETSRDRTISRLTGYWTIFLESIPLTTCHYFHDLETANISVTMRHGALWSALPWLNTRVIRNKSWENE